MSFKIRKIVALFLTLLNIFLAFFLHGSDFGLFILILSVLVIQLVWFKMFVSKWAYGGDALYLDNPFLIEIVGWILILVFLFYNIFLKNN